MALSEALYRELEQGGYKIGVSVICPGYVNTNIMECARNRPKELQNAPAETEIKMANPLVEERIRFARQMIEGGMPPQQVADIIFNAIREKKFYILPNAEQYIPFMQTRMEDIINQCNPTNIYDKK